VNQGNAQYWIFHDYPEFIIAEVVKDAIRIYQQSKAEYDEYCQKASEHAKKWHYKRVYPKLLRYINIM